MLQNSLKYLNNKALTVFTKTFVSNLFYYRKNKCIINKKIIILQG